MIDEKKKYHPIGGTVFNQLLNINRLHHYMTDLAGKHRTYRLISLFRSEIYTSDPANVEYMLKTNFENYGKGEYNYNILRDLLGDGIFTVDGDKWRQQRKVSSYEFSTKVLRDFSSVVFRKNVAKLAHVLSEASNSNQTINIQDLFMKSTLDSIFKVAFGVELDSMCGSTEEGTNFSNAFDDSSAMTLWRYVDLSLQIKKYLNIGSEALLKKNIEVVDAFVYRLIHSKIEQMHNPQDNSSAGPRIYLEKGFSYRQMKIVSMALLRFFHFKLADKTKNVTYKTMFTLHIDGGLHLRAISRT